MVSLGPKVSVAAEIFLSGPTLLPRLTVVTAAGAGAGGGGGGGGGGAGAACGGGGGGASFEQPEREEAATKPNATTLTATSPGAARRTSRTNVAFMRPDPPWGAAKSPGRDRSCRDP